MDGSRGRRSSSGHRSTCLPNLLEIHVHVRPSVGLSVSVWLDGRIARQPLSVTFSAFCFVFVFVFRRDENTKSKCIALSKAEAA